MRTDYTNPNAEPWWIGNLDTDPLDERECTNQRCYDYGTRVLNDHVHKPLGKDK